MKLLIKAEDLKYGDATQPIAELLKIVDDINWFVSRDTKAKEDCLVRARELIAAHFSSISNLGISNSSTLVFLYFRMVPNGGDFK